MSEPTQAAPLAHRPCRGAHPLIPQDQHSWKVWCHDCDTEWPCREIADQDITSLRQAIVWKRQELAAKERALSDAQASAYDIWIARHGVEGASHG